MKILALFLSVIILISTVSALTIKPEPINDAIIPQFNQPAKFTLTITDVEPGSYNIYTLTDVKLLPSGMFQIKYGENKIELYVYPTESLKIKGYYTFSYTFKKSNVTHDDKLTVKIVDLKDAVEISSDSNDPDSDKISFYIRNKENANLENLNAKFSSIFFEFNKTFDLEPHEKKEFLIDINQEKIKKISAGSYIIEAEFETLQGEEKVEGKIYLGEKKGVETQQDSAGVLISTKTITKINIGNVQETVTIKIRKNIFTRLFSSFNQEPDIIEREGFVVTYTWNKKLEPAGILTIKAKTNYIFPLLIIIFCILIILGIKRYIETKIEIKKSVSHVKTKGGEFALKVKINVKARKDVENVSLIDKIPALVKVYEKFGIPKPTNIDARNRRIQWDLGDMAAGEQRLFNYMIYSKVGIVGKFSLPEALAVFEDKDEIHEIESNKVFFLSEQIKGDS